MKALLPLSFVVAALAVLACGTPDKGSPDAGDVPADAAEAVCDPSKCAANNICVQNKCMLQCKRHLDCPNGYDCTLVEGQQVCTANNLPFGKGLFGYSCGVNGDKDCKADQGFFCYGPQADPESYCTRQDCAGDQDCPGNYRCASIDISVGKTKKACIKRGYCAPASGIVDCNDPDAVFKKDAQGRGMCLKSCTVPPSGMNPCEAGSECLSGACWPKVAQGDLRTCYPSKKYCGRCTSQLDCPSGSICYENDFSHERFCTTGCSATQACPTSPGGIPSSQCVQGSTAPCTYCGTVTGLEAAGNQCFPDPNQELGFGCFFR